MSVEACRGFGGSDHQIRGRKSVAAAYQVR
jgi:hypothetical protein